MHCSGRWGEGRRAIHELVAEDSGSGHCIAKLGRGEVDSGSDHYIVKLERGEVDSGLGHCTAKFERAVVDCYSDRGREWEQ